MQILCFTIGIPNTHTAGFWSLFTYLSNQCVSPREAAYPPRIDALGCEYKNLLKAGVWVYYT